MTNRGLLVIVAALLLGAAGFVLTLWIHHEHDEHEHDKNSPDGYAHHAADGHHPELDWLREELRITDAQMEKVKALHVAYHPVCEALTRRLEHSHRTLDALAAQQSTGISPELDAALKDHAAVHLDCQRAMLKHFYETAACLSAEQGRKYLDRMLPLVFQHDAAGGPEHPH